MNITDPIFMVEEFIMQVREAGTKWRQVHLLLPGKCTHPLETIITLAAFFNVSNSSPIILFFLI
jgi:hypothetical protein